MKVCLYLLKHNPMTMHGGLEPELQLQVFLTLVFDGGEQSATRPTSMLLAKRWPYPPAVISGPKILRGRVTSLITHTFNHL